MLNLEHKVPPPLVALLFALAMWALSRVTPALALDPVVRYASAAVLALSGGAVSFSGMLAFRRAKTTVNPLTPDKASTLVVVGIFRVTRNPMYLGLFLVLCGVAVLLANGFTLLGPVGFVLYIRRFQIAPEERAMHALFGDSYRDYQERVRRWL